MSASTQKKPAVQPVLELLDATVRFGGITAVNEFSMAIPKGMIAGLIGPNGAGKTTVFNIVTGFYQPVSGDIRFNGESVVGVAPHNICKKGIARTFQNIRLFQTESVLKNVLVGAHVRQKSQWWMPAFMWPSCVAEERAIRKEAMKLLDCLELADVADLPAGSLPYGAQRRLEIARALATQPQFLLLDEPAAGMNPQESNTLLELIKRIRHDFDLTILLIEHDMKVVMGVCDQIWVLEYGTCIAEGAPEHIRNDTRVIEAYLGEEFVHNAQN